MSRRNRRGILMNEQYREWMPFVVVIPIIVWESCVWLRPVGVVSIARPSCVPYGRTSHRHAWAYFSAIESSRSLFSDAYFYCRPKRFSRFRAEIPRVSDHFQYGLTKMPFIAFRPILFGFFFGPLINVEFRIRERSA